MINNKDILEGKSAYLYILFLCLLSYAYNDLQTSSSVGIREASRLNVYINIIILIALLAFYVFLSRSIYLDKISIAVLIVIFSMIYSSLLQNINKWALSVDLGLSVWWIFTYLFCSTYLRENPKGVHVLKVIFFSMMLFYAISAIYASINIRNIYNKDFAVLNLSYYVLVFLPYMLILENSLLKKIGIFIVFATVIFSFKRGAIIAFILMMLVYYCVSAVLNFNPIKFYQIAGLIVIFILMILIADKLSGGILKGRFMFEEIIEGSGRRENFLAAWNNCIQRNSVDFVFGLGSGASGKSLGINIHNEWLEFLFNFGLLGLLSYLNLFVSLLSIFRLSFISHSKYAPACAAVVVYFFLVGMYGMVYFAHSTFYLMAFLGLVKSDLNLLKFRSMI